MGLGEGKMEVVQWMYRLSVLQEEKVLEIGYMTI